jgi:hypothetical protein
MKKKNFIKKIFTQKKKMIHGLHCQVTVVTLKRLDFLRADLRNIIRRSNPMVFTKVGYHHREKGLLPL